MISVLLALLLVFVASPAFGATITSTTTGNWSSTGTWVGGVVPDDNDDAIIADGHAVTVDGAQEAVNVTVNEGGQLAFANSSTLTVTNDVDCFSDAASTTPDGGVLHPSSPGGATLSWGRDFDWADCDPDIGGRENLSLDHTGSGDVTYCTADVGEAACGTGGRKRWDFYDVTLGTGTTTLIDEGGHQGRDLTVHGKFTLGGGTLTSNQATCTGDCNWPPTIEVSQNGGGTPLLFDGSGIYDLENLEVEWGNTSNIATLNVGGYTFTSTFENFDFTGTGGTDDRGMIRLTGDLIAPNANCRIEKNGMIFQDGVTVQCDSFNIPTGSGVSADAVASWEVEGGTLQITNDCTVGDDDMSNGWTGAGNLRMGTGYVECGSLVFDHDGSTITGESGGRLKLTNLTSTTTGSDFYGSGVLGDDAYDGTAKDFVSGSTGPEQSFAALVNHLSGTNDHGYLRGGEVYSISGNLSVTGDQGFVGIYGDGTLSTAPGATIHAGYPKDFETRPTVAMDTDAVLTHTTANGIEYEHMEFRWGTALYAEIYAPSVECTAPCALIFHGDRSSRGGLTEDQDFTLLGYRWTSTYDVGEYWTTGAMADGTTQYPKWQGLGPNFAQHYTEAGTYTIDLRVYDGTATADATQVSITINDPDTEFPTTSTVCIAGGTLPVAGSDGCPADAAVVNAGTGTGAFDTQINGSNCGDNKRCLFKGGDSFDASGGAEIGCTNCQIGVYGTGRANIDCEGLGDPSDCIDMCDSVGMTDAQIYGLYFDGDNTTDTKAIWVQNTSQACRSVRTTYSDLEIRQFESGIHATHNYSSFTLPANHDYSEAQELMSDQFHLANNIVSDGGHAATNYRGGYDVFYMGQNAAIIGNRFADKNYGICTDNVTLCSGNADCSGGDNCRLPEHNWRSKGLMFSHWAHNDIGLVTLDGRGGCDDIRTTMTVRSSYADERHSGGEHDTEWQAYSRYNYFHDVFGSSCEQSEGNVLTIEPTGQAQIAYASHTNLVDTYMVDFTGQSDHGGTSRGINFDNGFHNVARNIAVNAERSAGNADGRVIGVRIGSRDGSNNLNPPAGNIVYNVSQHDDIDAGGQSFGVRVDYGKGHVVRNILIFDDSSAGSDVDPLDNTSGETVTSSSLVEVATNPYAAAIGGAAAALEDFKLSSQPGTFDGTTIEPGALTDAEGRCRYEDGTYDVGAHQFGAAQCLFDAVASTVIYLLRGLTQ